MKGAKGCQTTSLNPQPPEIPGSLRAEIWILLEHVGHALQTINPAKL